MNRFMTKKIVKWTYDVSALPKNSTVFAAANISADLDQITITAHPFETGDLVAIVSGTAATAPAADTAYYIIKVDDNTVSLATTLANAYAGTVTALTAGSAADVVLQVNTMGVVDTGIVLPLGAVVTGGYIDVKTSLASTGNATLAFSTGEGAADLLAATAVATFAANYTVAVLAGVPALGADDAHDTAAKIQVLNGASLIEMTADKKVTVTIATAAITAGKFDLVLEYII